MVFILQVVSDTMRAKGLNNIITARQLRNGNKSEMCFSMYYLQHLQIISTLEISIVVTFSMFSLFSTFSMFSTSATFSTSPTLHPPPPPLHPTLHHPPYLTTPTTPPIYGLVGVGVGGRGEGGGLGMGCGVWVEGYVSYSISTLRSVLLFQFIKD